MFKHQIGCSYDRLWIITIGFLTLLVRISAKAAVKTAACKVYCEGELLDTVQKAKLFSDSKTFVDMEMKMPPNQVLDHFNKLMNATRRNPSKKQIELFVNVHFVHSKTEYLTYHPKDWKENPEFINNLTDLNLKTWAIELNKLWIESSKKISYDVKNNSNLHSLIYLPYPVVLPGGRFKEIHYEDSYWIILGLLRSEMFVTAKGMIENLLLLVETYGFVPYSGRIYSLKRSGVPLLIPMVNEYYKCTKDEDFLTKHIDTLEKEFSYWLNTRNVEVIVKSSSMTAVRYVVKGTGPRPDAYLHDLEAARPFTTNAQKRKFYGEIEAASESGWDLSSRWIQEKYIRHLSITNLNPSKFLPVDLNAILCGNARMLSELYGCIKNAEKNVLYLNIFVEFKLIVNDLFWSETDGTWFDYDMISKRKQTRYYASSLIPLWTRCFDANHTGHIIKKVMKYLKREQLEYYMGGIPASLIPTGHQWDYPNAFAPIQLIIIDGLRNTDDEQAKKMAFRFARNWIKSTFNAYMIWKKMLSRYHAKNPFTLAYGGTYPPQEGFGWTNGVCIQLLSEYGNDMRIRQFDISARFSPLSITELIFGNVIVIFIF